MHDSVTVHIDAPIAEVWDLVSDVTRIGEFSPETFEAEWLDGATGPAEGARFRGHVKRNGVGPTYWTECVVQRCEEPHAFEFGVTAGGSVTNTWGYTLAEAEGGGTDATEYFRLTPSLPLKIYWTLLGWARGKTNREGMRKTLERMKAVLEPT